MVYRRERAPPWPQRGRRRGRWA